MGKIKTLSFTKRENKTTLIAKTVGNSARIGIFDYLLILNSCIKNDIIEQVSLTESSISELLKVRSDLEFMNNLVKL